MKKKEAYVKSIAISGSDGRQYLESARLIEGYGLENDQKRSEDRQIAIVSDKFFVNKNTIEKGFCHIKFKENLNIMHLDTKSIEKLDKFSIGDSIIMITRVYKKCHESCPRLQENEICQANLQVVFAKVVKSGYIKNNDLMIKL